MFSFTFCRLPTMFLPPNFNAGKVFPPRAILPPNGLLHVHVATLLAVGVVCVCHFSPTLLTHKQKKNKKQKKKLDLISLVCWHVVVSATVCPSVSCKVLHSLVQYTLQKKFCVRSLLNYLFLLQFEKILDLGGEPMFEEELGAKAGVWEGEGEGEGEAKPFGGGRKRNVPLPTPSPAAPHQEKTNQKTWQQCFTWFCFIIAQPSFCVA